MEQPQRTIRIDVGEARQGNHTPEEIEFMKAMAVHRRRRGYAEPSWEDVLEVLLGLGYGKAGTI